MTRSELPLLLHIAAHAWLGLAQVCVEAALAPRPERPALVRQSVPGCGSGVDGPFRLAPAEASR